MHRCIDNVVVKASLLRKKDAGTNKFSEVCFCLDDKEIFAYVP